MPWQCHSLRMEERFYRLGHETDQGWCEHSHPAVYQLPSENGSQRIVTTVPGSNPDVELRLAECLLGERYA